MGAPARRSTRSPAVTTTATPPKASKEARSMSTRELAIVETAEEITPAWLTAALGLDGVRVTGVAATQIGTGQVANCSRIEVRYDGVTHAPATLVAKLSDTDPEMRRQ